jgi:hypothetical protein
METTMKLTTRRAALVATAGVAAAIGSAIGGAPASAAPVQAADEPVTIQQSQWVVCNQTNVYIGDGRSAEARVTARCSGDTLTLTGWVSDTESNGQSGCIWASFPGGQQFFIWDEVNDGRTTRLPNNWKGGGNRVLVTVENCDTD